MTQEQKHKPQDLHPRQNRPMLPLGTSLIITIICLELLNVHSLSSIYSHGSSPYPVRHLHIKGMTLEIIKRTGRTE
jgi:hypothetical protein